jgi:hypothetical protein
MREIRRFQPTNDDGRLAILYMRRLPAVFYEVRSGDMTLHTGSGYDMGHLAYWIAESIADGMLSFRLAQLPEGFMLR